MSLIDLSGNLLFIAFIAYLVGTVFIRGSIKAKTDGAANTSNKWGKIGIMITIIGFISQLRLFYYTLDLCRTCSCK